MIYVIMGSAVSRNNGNRRWPWRAAGVFAAAAASTGALTGLLLGLLGRELGEGERSGAYALALFSLFAALAELARYPPLLQRSCETPKRLTQRGRAVGPLGNGLLLGFGASTRIGFWVWYVIPITCVLSANAYAGLTIFGTYGLVRGISPSLLRLVMRRGGGAEPTSDSLLSLLLREHRAHRLAGVYLLVVTALLAVAAFTVGGS